MLIKSLPVLTLFLTLTHAAALANPFTGIDTSDLAKRDCTPGCTCASGVSPGLYCGYCAAVTSCTSAGCFDNVYQCGNGGSCCSYGYRTSCANRQGPGC
ncbi:hypothetical protein B9Z19DRAFT_1095568 [Tuber borchii]|uniref:Uncharacterized protein n=1 Tax=Tuber borchii TaxID=42251 RepID=A0A2T6ZCJ1_TUBBO|nr:hypothetical protein B9Z19DRAFT_1095568 [Tuber borchii]